MNKNKTNKIEFDRVDGRIAYKITQKENLRRDVRLVLSISNRSYLSTQVIQ